VKKSYSTRQDIELCRAIHKQHGTTYYYATHRFPSSIKWRVHGLYAFVRIPDEWVDGSDGLTKLEKRSLLENWRTEMAAGLNGCCPTHPAMRVFCDAAIESGMPATEAHCFLDAMEKDLDCDRYATYEELRGYIRGSASAIGILMCYALGVTPGQDTLTYASTLGEAMQLTNFLRDIREDFERGRIYLPEEDMKRFGVSESDIALHRNTANFQKLMKFEIGRARSLYSQADPGIERLPVQVRKAVLLGRLLYSQILDRIEDQEYDVFTRRARTNLSQKAACATMVAVASKRILARLNGATSTALVNN